MAIDWPDSDEIATLGSRAAVNGYNWWENRWGSSCNIIQGSRWYCQMDNWLALEEEAQTTKKFDRYLMGLSLAQEILGE